MEESDLLKWSAEGFIPYEGESEEAFIKRVYYNRNLYFHLEKHLKHPIARQTDLLEPALVEAKALYGMSPDWVPVLISSEKLLPWHGGAALIFQLELHAPLAALIQLRERVISRFGSVQERLTHELAHVGRMGFEEKKYEEIIAYRSSKSPFRRLFGPLFQTSGESMLLVFLLLLVVVFDGLLLLSDSWVWYDRFLWLKALPLTYLLFLLIRLYFRQKTFQHLLAKLPLAIVYRMTDAEIEQLSRASPEEIQAYFIQGKQEGLRRHLLYHLVITHKFPIYRGSRLCHMDPRGKERLKRSKAPSKRKSLGL